MRSCTLGRAGIEPPAARVATTSTAPSNSRRLRGGGKYSSSSVIWTSSTPLAGLRKSITAWTTSSGAEAPAVTPTVPLRSVGSSSGPFTRNTRSQPASVANLARAFVLELFEDPMTTKASQRSAIAINADCRLVVAKQRSERPGVKRSGNRSRAASATSAQSRWLSVV